MPKLEKEPMVVISVHLPRQIINEIDNMVREGFFPNRSEFIRHAIRELILRYHSNGSAESSSSPNVKKTKRRNSPNVKKTKRRKPQLSVSKLVMKIRMLPTTRRNLLRRSVKEIMKYIEGSRGRRICIKPATFAEVNKHLLSRLIEAILRKNNIPYIIIGKTDLHKGFCFDRENSEKILEVLAKI